MHFLYELARYFPFWAIPIALILGEVGLFFRRRASVFQFPFFGMAGLIMLLTLIWFIGRGDLHSDKWVRGMFGK